jgi:long-chain acyl-CoA synthetase
MQKGYWPDYLSRTVEYKYGEKPLFEYVRDHAKRIPNKNALIFYGNEITWKELDELSERFANYLLDRGVIKGDRVALFMPNCPQFFIAYLGTNKAGAIIMPINAGYREFELEHLLSDAGAETIVTIDDLLPYVNNIKNKTRLRNVVVTTMGDFFPKEPSIKVSNMPELKNVKPGEDYEIFSNIMEQYPPEPVNVNVELDDVYNISFTSGTTGMPKGAMLTHRNALYKAAARFQHFFSYLSFKEEDIQLIDTPIMHIAGILRVNFDLYGGIPTVLLFRFDVEEALQTIEKYRITLWGGPIVGIKRILKLPGVEKYNLKSLRDVRVNSYGDSLTDELCNAWRNLAGTSLSEASYGLTEDHTGTTFIPPERIKCGSICCGLPVPETEIKIVDLETGEELPVNETGQICIKSKGVFKGYWNNPEATNEVLKDGWLYTGDLGRLDEDGYLWFSGRSKNMIKSYGFSVIPEEVENILLKHPAVSEALVVGKPEKEVGEAVKAFIVLKEGKENTTPEEIIEWCKGKMAGYKRPRYVEFRKEFPKNATGKILRKAFIEK